MTANTNTIVNLHDDQGIPIPKPNTSVLSRFKSKNAATIANVEKLQTALSCHSISGAKDFVRLHPNEETHWTDELCFVDVPIEGQTDNVRHLINDDLATQYLPSNLIIRHRLALASKPFDKFFLCRVPSQNLDNAWNETNLKACRSAQTYWTRAASRKAEGVDGYLIEFARHADAFADPQWPTQSLEDLVDVTFAGRMIESADHPALLRLIGAKQSVS